MTTAPQHLDAKTATDYVEARKVPAWVDRHLKKDDCEECHARLFETMHEVLAAVARGEDSRDVDGWYRDLGTRYTRRHLCPSGLVEMLLGNDAETRERATLHTRYCGYCWQEVADIQAALPRGTAVRLLPPPQRVRSADD